MVWANYMSRCNSIVELYFKGTCDVISVTMAMHKVHKRIFSFCKLSEKPNSVTYHFYFFVGKFPKFFNFSDGKEKTI